MNQRHTEAVVWARSGQPQLLVRDSEGGIIQQEEVGARVGGARRVGCGDAIDVARPQASISRADARSAVVVVDCQLQPQRLCCLLAGGPKIIRLTPRHWHFMCLLDPAF